MTQVVYADILLIVNTYVNYALIRLSGIVCKQKIKTLRLVAASLSGGLYSFIILAQNIPSIVIFLSRVLFAAVIILIAFGFNNYRSFLRLFTAFFLISFLFAGLMFTLWTFAAPSSMVFNNTIVYFDIDTLSLCIMTVICYCVLKLGTCIVRFKAPSNTIYDLNFYFCERSFSCKAFLDTGNSLTEPFSALPVIVLNKFVKSNSGERKTIEELLLENDCALRYIPCSGVGSETVLKAFKPQKIHIRSISTEIETSDVYIALTDKKIKSGDFDALLGCAVFENTKAENEKSLF